MEIIFSIIILAVLITGFIAFFWFFQMRLKQSKGDDQSLLMLHNQINEITRTLNEGLKENRESSERTTQGINRQISDFTVGITKVDAVIKEMGDSLKDVSSFQQIFRTPKLRGRWGELALEHILSQYFPKDMFSLQYFFKSGEAVDAILKLPDGKILPIDAKFPHDHFERMIEAKSDSEREIAKKSFAIEIKREIDDISQKYILPSEGTVDVALMYIPAEAVFFEIINSLPEISNYAHLKRIVLSSPNTFYLTLQVIQSWARDLQLGRKTQDFIKKINRITSDAQKLSESFNKLGKHLNDARSSYEDSDKRLELLKERTDKLTEIETEDIKKLE